jgi:hypothetical protein
LVDANKVLRICRRSWRSLLPGAPAFGVLDWQTYQGGTRGRWLWWGSPDLDIEGVRKDTGYKIYMGLDC